MMEKVLVLRQQVALAGTVVIRSEDACHVWLALKGGSHQRESIGRGNDVGIDESDDFPTSSIHPDIAGDKVFADCGPPANVEAWDEERYEYFGRPPDPRQYREFERYGSAYRVRTVVRVEVWTYNYGPSRFVDYVRFENGRVRRIESGGYGY